MKLGLLPAIVMNLMPEPLARFAYSGRLERLGGRVMDPKAHAFGRFYVTAARLNGPPTVEDARAGMKTAVRLFDRPAPPLRRKEDLRVPGAQGEIEARLYSDARRGDEPRPLLVYYHGGGWFQGDLDTHDGLCARLARWAGCLVISVAYRLAPEHKFPAGVEDAMASFRWIRDNAAELGGDPERIGVAGDSAGGNLAAVICQQLVGSGERTPDLQVLIYPMLDSSMTTASMRELTDAYVIPRDHIAMIIDQYVDDRSHMSDRRISPADRPDLKGLPKALIVVAGFDPLRDEGIAYADRLRKDGTEATLLTYDGQIHGFVIFTRAIPQGYTCTREIASWLKSAW